jgi:hypothetical protein
MGRNEDMAGSSGSQVLFDHAVLVQESQPLQQGGEVFCFQVVDIGSLETV